MRLIDADKLKAHYAWWGNDGEEYRERKADFDVIVDLQPTVDPVKHGRWIHSSNDTYPPYCSKCSQDAIDYIESDYCPNCGAKMDDGEEDGNTD